MLKSKNINTQNTEGYVWFAIGVIYKIAKPMLFIVLVFKVKICRKFLLSGIYVTF